MCTTPKTCVTTWKAFGVPDERMGEELAVWIKLNRWNHERVNLKTFLFHCSSAQLVFSNNNKMKIPSGASIEEAELRQFCKGKLSHFKIPRYIEFVEDFPTTVTGKIQKFVMR